MAGKERHQAAAAAAVNALWAALDHEEHCKYILQGKHLEQLKLYAEATGYKDDVNPSLHVAIKALGHHLPTQLTAAACLMRLCLVEMEQQPCRLQADISTGPYCMAALDAGTLENVFESISAALQVTCLPATAGCNPQFSVVHCLFFAKVLTQGVSLSSPVLFCLLCMNYTYTSLTSQEQGCKDKHCGSFCLCCIFLHLLPTNLFTSFVP